MKLLQYSVDSLCFLARKPLLKAAIRELGEIYRLEHALLLRACADFRTRFMDEHSRQLARHTVGLAPGAEARSFAQQLGELRSLLVEAERAAFGDGREFPERLSTCLWRDPPRWPTASSLAEAACQLDCGHASWRALHSALRAEADSSRHLAAR